MFKKDLNWFQMGSEDRKEFKFIFNNNQLEDFKFNYKLTNDKKLFEKRKITSLYLDTINYDLFQISKASDIEKFKLRYRQYNDSSDIYEEKAQLTKKTAANTRKSFASFVLLSVQVCGGLS